MEHKNIVLIMGMSGTGKTTIAKRCEETYGLKQIQSYTTRPKRNPDETGHTFVTSSAFDKLYSDMAVWTVYNGYRYGATNEQANNSDLYVINPGAVNEFKKNYKGNKGIVTVYIRSSNNDHEEFNTNYERLRSRGDTVEEAAERVVFDKREFSHCRYWADHVFINENPEDIDAIASKLNDIVMGKEVK